MAAFWISLGKSIECVFNKRLKYPNNVDQLGWSKIRGLIEFCLSHTVTWDRWWCQAKLPIWAQLGTGEVERWRAIDWPNSRQLAKRHCELAQSPIEINIIIIILMVFSSSSSFIPPRPLSWIHFRPHLFYIFTWTYLYKPFKIGMRNNTSVKFDRPFALFCKMTEFIL